MEKFMFKSGRPRGRHNSQFEMAAFPQEKEPGPVPGSLTQHVSLAKKRLSASFSFWPPFSLASSPPSFWVSLWPSSSAQPSFSPLSWALAVTLAQVSAREFLLQAPRLQWPAPLPRFRPFPEFRRPAPRRLPAATARCHLRSFLSRNPFRPPLGESPRAVVSRVGCLAALSRVLQEHPVLAPLFVIVLDRSCQVVCEARRKRAFKG